MIPAKGLEGYRDEEADGTSHLPCQLLPYN